MLIIGLSGKAGAGKDTAANILESRFNQSGITTGRISFAKPIKDICAMLFGWDRAKLDSDPYYKEGGLGGWVPKGKPGAKPVSAREITTTEDWIELDTDIACVMMGKTRRTVMQEIGTEAMRTGLHSDIWIICTRLAIQRGELNTDVGFVTDCRFLNEMKFIRDMDGLLVQIERPNVGTLTGNIQHESELQWLTWGGGWDYTIRNPGDDSFSTNLNSIFEYTIATLEVSDVG